jgi:hypothetical protein
MDGWMEQVEKDLDWLKKAQVRIPARDFTEYAA